MTVVQEAPVKFKKHLLTDDLLRAWRDATQPEADNKGYFFFRGPVLSYNSQTVGIRRIEPDGSVLFLMNGDNLQVGGGWNAYDPGQRVRTTLLQKVPDREGVAILWRHPKKGAPPEPKQEDFGYVEPTDYEVLPKVPKYPTSPYGSARWREDFAKYREANEKLQLAKQRNGDKRSQAYKEFKESGGYDRFREVLDAWRDEWVCDVYADTLEPVVRRDCNLVIIPFSTLRAAHVDPMSVKVIDYQGERNIKVPYFEKGRDGKIFRSTREQHLLGSCAFSCETPRFKKAKRTVNRYQRYYATAEEAEGKTDEQMTEARWWRDVHSHLYGHKTPWYKYESRPVEEEYDEQDGTEVTYYLSGIDESGRDLREAHFLAKLPRPVVSVADAYESLKPTAVVVAEKAGLTVERQGEWFFIPASPVMQERLSTTASDAKAKRKKSPLDTVLRLRRPGRIAWVGTIGAGWSKIREYGRPTKIEFTTCTWEMEANLPDSSARSSSHFADEMIRYGEADSLTYVRGRIRHSRDDHQDLWLEAWHIAVENTALASWAPEANGRRVRVD